MLAPSRMSQDDSQRTITKKQFKSQSVNNLFRQQATSSTNSSENGNSHDHPALNKKKSAGSSTKLKLVSKKVNMVNRSKLERKKVLVKDTSPPVWSRSQSPEVKETFLAEDNKANNNKESIEDAGQKIINNNPQTNATIIAAGKEEIRQEAVRNQEPTPTKTPEATLNQEEIENFNWADDDQDNVWLDLQNQIHNETKPVPKNESLWSSPSSKISSFRKNTTPIIASLNQSPLINSTNDIFNEPNELFALQPRQSSNDSRYKSPGTEYIDQDSLWNQNYNLWNSEDRQLSTKSDSTLLWSPFNNKKNDLDDPLKFIGLESQIRQTTSRFFPSPQVEQEKTPIKQNNNDNFIGRTPEKKPSVIRSKSIDDSISDIIKLINSEKKHPAYLQTSSAKSEQDLFPEHFNTNSTGMDIQVSFPVSYTTQQELQEQNRLPGRSPQSTITNEQYYPEGFASTFYKRGINNFMFVRELQPKLITSKAKDSVEVRISLPSINTNLQPEEDIFFKMRCYIINVGLRELNGKSNGYKLSQKGNNIGNYHGSSNGYGRARYGNATYSRNQGYSRRN